MPKIYVYPADQAGCGSFRLTWPAQALRSQGHDVVIMSPQARGLGGGLDANGRLVEVQYPADADVIVMQRLTFGPTSQAVSLLRQAGVAVVVDMDDDLSTIHPANPAFDLYRPRRDSQHSWRNAELACKNATLVTTSTDALISRYASHGRGVVLRNCVPAAYLDLPRHDSDVIGWGGTVRTHPDDLQQLGNAAARLVGEGHRFKVVGPPDGVQDALRLPHPPDSTGTVDLMAWPQALSTLGIGVAPLAQTMFNRSKSWLKPLEKAAAGVPVVVSPSAEYQRLHREGVGLLAGRPKDWYRQLRRLIDDPGLRADMSAAGRDVAARHTIEDNAWRWLEAWMHAYKLQRHAATVAA